MQALIEKGKKPGIWRLAVVALFAVLFAVLLSIYGPMVENGTYEFFNRGSNRRLWEPGSLKTIIPLAGLGLLIGSYLGSLTFSGLEKLAQRWDRMDKGDKVTLYMGVFAGIFSSYPFLILISSLPIPNKEFYLPGISITLTLGLALIAVYTLQSMSDILPWYKNRGPAKRSGIKILDTNVIIDGRIYDIARSGFLEGEIYVPKFVLEELQHIADHHDSLKRQRGRRGLEVLKRIQAEFTIEVGRYDRYANDAQEEVDARLVRMAKAIGADIVTNDWNLNSVAKLQNVKILNINELALNLRPNILPQEQLTILVAREGNQAGQGVGYLEDGTMVVVEGGRGHIGNEITVTVTQLIQTERGKMIFAETDDANEEFESYSRRRRRT